jgi:hypothetical protein
MKYYEKAATFAEKNLPQGHQIIENLQRTMKTASKHIQEIQDRVDRRKVKTTLPRPHNYLTNLRAATSTGPKRPIRKSAIEDDSEDSSLLLNTQPLVARRGEPVGGRRGKSQPRPSGAKSSVEEERSSTGFELLGEVQ